VSLWSLAYFGLVFGAGFVLGPIRILWLVPKVGVRAAELIEMPIMIALTVLAARWIVRRFNVPFSLGVRISIGLIALCFMVVAEIGFALALSGRSLSEYIAGRDPISGTAFLIALAAFAIMPSVIGLKAGRAAHRENLHFD
jgi:hypothetical protein